MVCKYQDQIKPRTDTCPNTRRGPLVPAAWGKRWDVFLAPAGTRGLDGGSSAGIVLGGL